MRPSTSSAFMCLDDMDVQGTALHMAAYNGHLDIARYRVSLMACMLASACMRVCSSLVESCVRTDSNRCDRAVGRRLVPCAGEGVQ